MLDLYLQLKDPDMPWFDAAAKFVHSRKNIERTFLEKELKGETHLYLIHGYRARGRIITWYELRNKTTGMAVGPDSHYGLIDDCDLEAHATYCRLHLENTVCSDTTGPDEIDLMTVEPMGEA